MEDPREPQEGSSGGVEDHEGSLPATLPAGGLGGAGGWTECSCPVDTWLRALSRLRHWMRGWGGPAGGACLERAAPSLQPPPPAPQAPPNFPQTVSLLFSCPRPSAAEQAWVLATGLGWARPGAGAVWRAALDEGGTREYCRRPGGGCGAPGGCYPTPLVLAPGP